MNKYLKSFLQFLFFLGLGSLILYILYDKESASYYLEFCEPQGIAADQCSLFDKIAEDFRSTNYYWIGFIVIAFMLSNVFRALRWQMMLEAVDEKARFSNAFMATMIGYFANLGLPRMGEIIKSGIVAKYDNIEVEKVLGTVVSDRIIDLIFFALMILLALFFEYDTLWGFLSSNIAIQDTVKIVFEKPLFLLSSLFGITALIVIIMRSSLVKNSKLYLKIRKMIEGFAEGIFSIFKLKRPYLFLFYSVGIWGLYYMMTFVCFQAYDPTMHLGPREGLLVFVFGTLGILVPTPGGLGAYQYLIKEALMIYGINSADAFSFANIIYFSIQILGNIFFGILSIILLPFFNRKQD